MVVVPEAQSLSQGSCGHVRDFRLHLLDMLLLLFFPLPNIVDWCFIELLADSMMGKFLCFRHTFSKWNIIRQLKHPSLTAGQFFRPLSLLGCDIFLHTLHAIPGEPLGV